MQRFARAHKLVATTAALLLLTAVAALAYWVLVDVVGEGEQSHTIGKQGRTTETVPLMVRYPEGMIPGKPVPFEVFLNRSDLNVNHPMEIRRAVLTITNSAEGAGCKSSWFHLVHLQGDEPE